MTASPRCTTVFAALHTLGRDVETSQWWQDVAFSMYDDAAYDGNILDAATLRRWLENYHL